MRVALLCSKGLEDAVLQELAFRFNLNGEKRDGVVLVEANNEEQVIALCYLMQTTTKIVLVLDEGTFPQISVGDANAWVEESFAVRSNNQDVEGDFGSLIQGKVDLTNPHTTFFAYVIDETFIFGIDLLGFDAGKRSYKLFQHNDGLKGTTAAAMLFLAGYTGEQTLLDPFCGSGMVAIEAAHISRERPINYYNKNNFALLKLKGFKDVAERVFQELDNKEHEGAKIYAFADNQKTIRNAEKNAKLAGVNKHITFSRQDIEWLDTKCEEGEIELIVTNIIEPSRFLAEKKINKIYQDFFYVLDYILSGKVLALMRNPPALVTMAEEKGYETSILEFQQGKTTLFLVTLKKERTSP
jgi:putative N6-adenine-specific DNA methylase